MPKTNNVPMETWDAAADLYELGFKHACDIARDLGVSPQTVTREMKRRGAIKGHRAHMNMAELEAFLDRKACRRAHAKAIAETTMAERRAMTFAVLNGMMGALMDADAQGNLTLADSEITRTAAVFGARVSTKSPRR